MRVPLALRLRYTLGRYIPILKVAPPYNKQTLFNLRPVRHAAIEWEVNGEGEALLKIPRRRDRVGRIVGFWFRLPETRAVQLDEVGTYVWELCSGEHTIESIIKQTCKQYKMNRREVEISVTTYLQMLAERNFIGYYQRGGKS
jgi:hypothetical protein